MEKQQFKTLIINCLNNRQTANLPASSLKTPDTKAVWDTKKDALEIDYLQNGKKLAHLEALRRDIEHVIQFRKQNGKATFDEAKLDQLTLAIENNLRQGGEFKLQNTGSIQKLK